MLNVVVRDRDSIIEISLLENGLLVGSDGITRCDLVLKRLGMDDLPLSSVGAGQESWFDLQYQVTVGGRAVNVIRINLKDIEDPPPDGRCEGHVFLWDEEHTSGRFWGTIPIEIRAQPPAPVEA